MIAEAQAILALLEDAPHLRRCVGVKARRGGGCWLLADAAVCARLPFYARSSSDDLPRNACAVQKAGLRDEGGDRPARRQNRGPDTAQLSNGRSVSADSGITNPAPSP